jgi:hypothetical protein
MEGRGVSDDVFTFTFSIGEQGEPHMVAHLEVPMALTPKQEAKLRRLMGEEPFGNFCERIDEWRKRRERAA